MPIILEGYPLPPTGPWRLNVMVEANIKVSAEEAQKAVSRRLFNEVSYLLWGETPSLVVGERAAWRVPAYIGLVGVGRIGPLATIDVDVETGAMQAISPEVIVEMKQRVQNHLAGHAPPATASG